MEKFIDSLKIFHMLPNKINRTLVYVLTGKICHLNNICLSSSQLLLCCIYLETYTYIYAVTSDAFLSKLKKAGHHWQMYALCNEDVIILNKKNEVNLAFQNSTSKIVKKNLVHSKLENCSDI